MKIFSQEKLNIFWRATFLRKIIKNSLTLVGGVFYDQKKHPFVTSSLASNVKLTCVDKLSYCTKPGMYHSRIYCKPKINDQIIIFFCATFFSFPLQIINKKPVNHEISFVCRGDHTLCDLSVF